MFNFNPCHKFKVKIRELVNELNRVREERNKLLFKLDEFRKVINQNKKDNKDKIIFVVINDEFQPLSAYTTYQRAYLEADKHGYDIIAITLDQPLSLIEKESK